jgi:uncharacterized membrane protein (UPF0127 family)
MIRLVWASAVNILFNAAIVLADCADSHVHLSGTWGTAQFTVEVADDDTERAKGLMYRDVMGKFSGMLFVYNQPQEAAFWMKNTKISLDILYFNSEGRLVDVHANTIPGDLTPLRSSRPIQYVLEINAGMVKMLKLGSDTVLNHVSLDQGTKTTRCK